MSVGDDFRNVIIRYTNPMIADRGQGTHSSQSGGLSSLYLDIY